MLFRVINNQGTSAKIGTVLEVSFEHIYREGFESFFLWNLQSKKSVSRLNTWIAHRMPMHCVTQVLVDAEEVFNDF